MTLHVPCYVVGRLVSALWIYGYATLVMVVGSWWLAVCPHYVCGLLGEFGSHRILTVQICSSNSIIFLTTLPFVNKFLFLLNKIHSSLTF